MRVVFRWFQVRYTHLAYLVVESEQVSAMKNLTSGRARVQYRWFIGVGVCLAQITRCCGTRTKYSAEGRNACGKYALRPRQPYLCTCPIGLLCLFVFLRYASLRSTRASRDWSRSKGIYCTSNLVEVVDYGGLSLSRSRTRLLGRSKMLLSIATKVYPVFVLPLLLGLDFHR